MENQQNFQKKKKKKKSYTRTKQRVFTKKYSDENVSRLKRLIQNHTDRGNERYFAIKVDGEFCVNKISTPKYFDDYKEFIDGSTESIEIIMYFGKSNNCNRHIFYLKENSLGNVAPVDVDKKIEDALRKKDQEYLIKSLTEQVDQQNEYIEQLEEELEGLNSKTDIRGILKEGAALLGAIKNLPSTNTSLSGIGSKKEESEVKVEPVGKSDSEESDTMHKEAFEKVYEQFGKEGTKQVVGLMVRLSNSEELRKGINDLLEKENTKKETETKKNSS